MIGKQMDLFKSKRQRGVKAPAPSEFGVHVAIADTLNRWICPGWIYWHTPNEGARSRQVNPKTGKTYSLEQQRLFRMGFRSGVSDFLLIGPPVATLHAYELKRLGEEPTDAQARFGFDVIRAGGFWAWGDTYDHAIHTFQTWGVLPGTIHPQ